MAGGEGSRLIRCLVPLCHGISRTDLKLRERLWDGYFTAAPRQRTPSELQYSRSKAPLKELSERYGLNPKTVAKWKKRTFVHDAPMGPKDSRSAVLSIEEEAMAFRKHTLLPLDDCLNAL